MEAVRKANDDNEDDPLVPLTELRLTNETKKWLVDRR